MTQAGNFEVTQAIQSVLEPQERLLWSGQPIQGIRLRSSDLFLIPFSLLWGGFAIFWEYNVIGSGAPSFFALFGVPFVLVGLYFIFGRFFVDAKIRKKTFYGLTDERVIIVSGLSKRTIKSLSLRTLTGISVSESSDGSGSISFGSTMPYGAMFNGMPWPGMEQRLGPRFDPIEGVRAVHLLIRDAQKNAA